MLIATFGPGTGWAGKTITFEDEVFILEGHGPITAADVMEYDRQEQLAWATEGTRGWVGTLAGGEKDSSSEGMTILVASMTSHAVGAAASKTGAKFGKGRLERRASACPAAIRVGLGSSAGGACRVQLIVASRT